MINRLFGNYLVDKKVLTQTQLDDLLPVQKDFKAEVETIAVINKRSEERRVGKECRL